MLARFDGLETENQVIDEKYKEDNYPAVRLYKAFTMEFDYYLLDYGDLYDFINSRRLIIHEFVDI